MYLIRTALVAAGMLALGLPLASPASASSTAGGPGGSPPRASTGGPPPRANTVTPYHFRTLDDGANPTFNELLGINDHGKIAGYYGSGARSNPSKGYLLASPYGAGNYQSENFPGSMQSQVTGLDDIGISVGILSYTNDANPANNASYGFWARGGRYHKVVFPTLNRHHPQVNQLLGVNNLSVAVGFYLNPAGDARGYTYSVVTHRFTTVQVAGAVSVIAAAINNHGAVAGYFTTTGDVTKGFLRRPSGALVVLAKPGADVTQAFGVSVTGEVVGTYTVGSSTYGFRWTPRSGFTTVSDPSGVGSTVVNGVNKAGDLVGYYVGSGGNTNGMLATP